MKKLYQINFKYLQIIFIWIFLIYLPHMGFSIGSEDIFVSYITNEGYSSTTDSFIKAFSNRAIFKQADGTVAYFDGRGFKTLKKFKKYKYLFSNRKINDIAVIYEPVVNSGRYELYFIATNKGLIVTDFKIFREFTKKDGLLDNNIKIVKIDNMKRIFCVSLHGISAGNLYFKKISDNVPYIKFYSFVPWKNFLYTFKIFCINFDSRNNLWLGTDSGLRVFDGNKWYKFTTKDGLPTNIIKSITFDKYGRVWVAGYSIADGGVGVFDGDGFVKYGIDSGVPSKRVEKIVADENVIWVATDNGVGKFDGKWHRYSKLDGLLQNRVSDIAVTDKAIFFRTTGRDKSGISILYKRPVME